MDLTERRLDELSEIRYRIFTCDISAKHRATAMILSFCGSFGDGSAGNDDGVFMRMTTLAALSVWHAHAVVFDLRDLSYTWGNGIWDVFGRGIKPSGVEDLPYATVISDKCREGFSTCMPIIEPAFDDLEAAIANVTPRVQERLEDLWSRLESQDD